MKFLLAVLFLLTGNFVLAQTIVGGTIGANTVWNASGSPYIVTSDVTVAPGVTLNIKPGVAIKFDKGIPERYNIIVNGVLRAIGTEDSLIRFTSNEFVPSSSDWGAFIFNEEADDYNFIDNSGCILQFCKIEYGGHHTPLWSFDNFLIVMEGSAVFIDNCHFSNPGSNKVISARNCTQEIKITNNKFLSVGSVMSASFMLEYDSLVDISCNLFFDNSNYVLYSNGNTDFHNNIIVNGYGTGFDMRPSNTVRNNMIIDNTDVNHFYVHCNMKQNTITRNSFANISSWPTLINLADSNAKFNGNNIYDLNFTNSTSEFYYAGTLLLRTSVLSPVIDAASNWFKMYDVSEIDQLIYDYNDDTSHLLINYLPFLMSPDIDAPITPPTGVVKTYLGNDNVQITWNANPDSDVAGYKVFWGDPTGYSFSNSVDVGNTTSYILTGFLFSDTVAVTAYDTEADGQSDQCEGNESWFTYDYMYTGIPPVNSSVNSFLCYPNPADEFTYINMEGLKIGTAELMIISTLGKPLQKFNLELPNQQAIPLNHLPEGIYHLRLLTDNSGVYFSKLTVIR